MKAVKRIRWEHAKITHDVYEDIVVNEEIEFLERDKDFLLRCPRIKHYMIRKENSSFLEEDAFTKIKLTDNTENNTHNNYLNSIYPHKNNNNQ